METERLGIPPWDTPQLPLLLLSRAGTIPLWSHREGTSPDLSPGLSPDLSPGLIYLLVYLNSVEWKEVTTLPATTGPPHEGFYASTQPLHVPQVKKKDKKKLQLYCKSPEASAQPSDSIVWLGKLWIITVVPVFNPSC